jgi:LCP family protein required for cell wall assembly
MGFNTSNLRKIFLVLLAILIVLCLILVYFYLRERKKSKDLGPIKPFNEIVKQEEDDGYDLLFLGYGGAGHSGGGLADAIILAHIAANTNKIYLIHIPRDLWVDIPIRSDESRKFKINMAFAIGNDDKAYPYKETQYQGKNGGGELEKHVVGELTGFRVDNYVAIDFGSYIRAIDALGGIDVNVQVPFTDSFYPVTGLEDETCGKSSDEIAQLSATLSGFTLEKEFKCRYETLTFTKGVTHMDGTTALKFVRSRHSDSHGGDFARGERQVEVLEGIKDKLLRLDALDNVPKFYDEFSNMVSTDMDLDAARSIVKEFGGTKYEINEITLSTDNILENSVSSDGQYILLPKDGQSVKNYIKGIIGL